MDEMGIPEDLEELQRHRAVHYFSSTTRLESELHFVEDGDNVTVQVPGTVAVNETGLYIKLGLEGLGLMQLAEILVADHLRAGELVEVLADMQLAPVPVSLVSPFTAFSLRRCERSPSGRLSCSAMFAKGLLLTGKTLSNSTVSVRSSWSHCSLTLSRQA
ncbi:hypothetical protein D3C81_1791900 [compost metagenome]